MRPARFLCGPVALGAEDMVGMHQRRHVEYIPKLTVAFGAEGRWSSGPGIPGMVAVNTSDPITALITVNQAVLPMGQGGQWIARLAERILDDNHIIHLIARASGQQQHAQDDQAGRSEGPCPL